MTKGKISNVIRGGDGKILHEDTREEIKGSDVIYSGDGKRILYQNKDEGKE
jgi:hypothetical protein